MKNLYSIFIFTLILLPGILSAQALGTWEPCSENPVDGTFGINGVRAYYQLNTCNNIETVLLKVENLNNYAVKVGWNDVAFTNEDKELTLARQQQDSLTVAANSSAVGDCAGKYTQLAIKLSDFGTDKYNFQTFRVINFDFVLVH
jgi:hypothetical protein